MNPLNTFPIILDFVRLSPFLLRVIVSVFLISLGRDRSKKDFAWLSIFYFFFGILILLGLYTQISAIVSIVILKVDFYLDYWKNRKIIPVEKNSYFLYWMAGIILISLLFTGAGFRALDLPF